MIDWAVALAVVACVLVVVTLFWVRAAFVSLNADLRELLDRQAEIRKRLDALERCGIGAEKG